MHIVEGVSGRRLEGLLIIIVVEARVCGGVHGEGVPDGMCMCV